MKQTSGQSQHLATGLLLVTISSGLVALGMQLVLETEGLATLLVSKTSWANLVIGLGGTAELLNENDVMRIGLGRLFLCCTAISCITACLGGWLIAWRTKRPFLEATADWCWHGWKWWLAPGAWYFVALFAFAMHADRLASLLPVFLIVMCAILPAGWVATFFALFTDSSSISGSALHSESHPTFKPMMFLSCLIAGYVLIFTWMNWQLYNGLLIPHGDSAMYEEHLWNIWHGKGFRSYLDQGLFLGEHLQVIHLLLLPLHFIWPSHLTLELCESLVLACAALPVYWIALRHTGSTGVALCLGAAYLLYLPMHYLDIAVDLKSFRPTSFGILSLLVAIDLYERRRWVGMIIAILITLSAKEEYAIVIAMLGVWIFFDSQQDANFSKTEISAERPSRNRQRLFGSIIAGSAVIYLLLAVQVIIPWFREGGTVHYAAYFGELGNSPGELVKNACLHPLQFIEQLLTSRTLYYVCALLAPLGFLPLCSPSRLAVMLPLFAILSLMTLQTDPATAGSDILIPWHHFHAPLIPILFWSAAAGIGNLSVWQQRFKTAGRQILHLLQMPIAGCFVLCCALFTGMFLGYSPLSIGFWDSGSDKYWKNRYQPSRRAEMFQQVIKLIPPTAKVASTDFVHPRFTHYARSYDYSHFARRVSGYENRVPADTDFIVIDTQHRYSDIKSPEEVRELKENPAEWILYPDVSDGYFILLRRRSSEICLPSE